MCIKYNSLLICFFKFFSDSQDCEYVRVLCLYDRVIQDFKGMSNDDNIDWGFYLIS